MSTLNTPFQYKKKITLNYPIYAAMGFFSRGLKKEFETAVVNDPSVFGPLKVYCYGEAYHKNVRTQQLKLAYTSAMPDPSLLFNISTLQDSSQWVYDVRMTSY